MPARGEQSDWVPILGAIRRRHPDVPIFVFGGHTHVRDCVQYDGRSIGVVPGKYMETIAFTSASLPKGGDSNEPLSMTRRYLDANRQSYMFHSYRDHDHFDTLLGTKITTSLLHLAVELNISEPLGRAPHDLFLSRYPYGDERSVLTEWMGKVIPTTVRDPKRKGPRVFIAQSGSLRFNVFRGIFDRNDELTVSPFENTFAYVSLPSRLAKRITAQLNLAGPSRLVPTSAYAWQDDEQVDRIYNRWLSSQWHEHSVINALQNGHGQVAFSTHSNLTLGYVTRDACPGLGDDIEHIPGEPSVRSMLMSARSVPHSNLQPDFLCTPFPSEVNDDDLIDVAILTFSLYDFLVAVNTLDPDRNLSVLDVKPYAAGVAAKNLWGQYASLVWQGHG